MKAQYVYAMGKVFDQNLNQIGFSSQRIQQFKTLAENQQPGISSLSNYAASFNKASPVTVSSSFQDPSGLGKGSMPTRQRVSNGIYSAWVSTMGQ